MLLLSNGIIMLCLILGVNRRRDLLGAAQSSLGRSTARGTPTAPYGRPLAQNAYFIDFARDLQGVTEMPLMVAGGIRHRAVVEQVIASGIAMAGNGTVLAMEPDLARQWRQGRDNASKLRPIIWMNKALASMGTMTAVKFQLRQLDRGHTPDIAVSPV